MNRLSKLLVMQPTTQQRGQPRSSGDTVPSHEVVLAFVMKNLEEPQVASHPKDRQRKSRFKRIERNVAKFDFGNNAEAAGAIMAEGLSALGPERRELLRAELIECFRRYEALHWQIVAGRATRKQVMWVLAHRFVVPWIALRVAFRSRVRRAGTRASDHDWFVPVRNGRLSSTLMTLVDAFVREVGESDQQLALRLENTKAPDTTINKQSLRSIREDAAGLLADKFSKYRRFKHAPSIATLELLAANAKTNKGLQQKLVMARFLVRCIADALSMFDEAQVISLAEYFMLCLRHFQVVIKQALEEAALGQISVSLVGDSVSRMRTKQAERLWLSLQSMTLMGDTPGQYERFYPLMDEFMNELPRRINVELRRVVRSGELSSLPRNEIELNSGVWRFPQSVRLPEEIAGAPHRFTVKAAIDVSAKTFKGRRVDLAAAEHARRKFEFLGLGTFVVKAQGRPGFCSDEDAGLAEVECKRLFSLIHARTAETQRARVGVRFLKYLIEPYRPKTWDDRERAHDLFTTVSMLLHGSKLDGAVRYVRGCFSALDGDHRAALVDFKAARSLGREACGGFWIDLLRAGLVNAVRAKSDRERKQFGKLCRLFGLFSTDPTPRTNIMKAQMMEQAFLQADSEAFQAFPTG